VRAILVVLASLTALIAAFYAEEDWRGRRDWNQYRQDMEARGESLDLRTYVPKPVPDDENFCATPFLKSLFQTNDNRFITMNDPWLRAESSITSTNVERDRGNRHFTDLVAWQEAFAAVERDPLRRGPGFETTNTGLAERAAAAPAVLEWLKRYAADFAELRAASVRQYSICPVVYDLEDPWPILGRHLSELKYPCHRLDLEACAELAAGQPDPALADVRLSLALADSYKSEPFQISYLVRVACFQISTRAVWEGLAEHRWTDAQLQELQARFLSFDFLGDLQQTLMRDRAYGVLRCEQIKKKGLVSVLDIYGGGFFGLPAPKVALKCIGWVMPSGWYDQEKLNYCRQFEEQFKGVVDPSARTISPRPSLTYADNDRGQLRGGILKAAIHHKVLAATANVGQVAAKAATSQTCANQAALACALERYRLANGHFPDTLDALTPRFIARLPNDVIGGQPYKYRRTGDGQFVLYSVGWNEKDDGGVPGKRLFDETQGDWVWSYPAR
jgi:hypothetical protein